jgi:AcrR family transcriptional regulator
MAAGARGKGRPKLTEAAEIDRAIHEAALRVLLEQGEGATMNAVAVAAGISRKSLYARHPNKTELFLDVIRDLLKPVHPLEFATDGDAGQRLHGYVEAALKVIALPQSLTIQHLLRIDAAYIAALRPEMVEATRKIFFDPLLALLSEAAASGEVAIDDIPGTAQAVIRLILAESVVMDERSPQIMTPTQQAEYATFLTSLVMRGIAPR